MTKADRAKRYLELANRLSSFWRLEDELEKYLPDEEGEIATALRRLAEIDRAMAGGWKLVPPLLTTDMANAIRLGAESQIYTSWPANCWEGALEVAPDYRLPEHKDQS